jgi:hypothetical protein
MLDQATSRRAALAAATAVLTALAALGPTAAAPAAAAVDICRATESDLDLNGDGYDDAVVGDPYATVAGKRGAGAVVVLYGDADRRIGEGRRALLTQASVPGSNVEAGDHFGWSVALDDATGDGCADLLVGSPGEDWRGHVDAGIVHLISSTPDGKGGPGTARADLLDQAELGGSVEAGDRFGSAVALGDSGGGSDDATGAVGAPGEDLGSASDAGAVNTFGYEGRAVRGVTQRVQGVGLPGVPETGDRLGSAVLVAPLWVTDGVGVGVEPSVVAGAPGDAVPRADGTLADGAGSVTTWDLVTGFEQTVTQETAGVPGAAEVGDGFGASLAFSESATTGTAVRHLAVGAPGEDVGAVRDAGSVTLLDDVPATGLGGGVALTQSTADFAGSVETGDRFGHSVALRPRNAALTLVIGTPFEDLGSVSDAGMVQTAEVFGTAATVQAAASYTESSPGTPGTVARGNRFGLTLAAMEGVAESVVAVASPVQGAGSVFLVSSDGDTRAWVPGRGGVPASSGRFGWALGGLQTQR